LRAQLRAAAHRDTQRAAVGSARGLRECDQVLQRAEGGLLAEVVAQQTEVRVLLGHRRRRVGGERRDGNERRNEGGTERSGERAYRAIIGMVPGAR